MSIYIYAHMDSIGKRLRVAREQLGMNQTEFGALGGVQMRAQINYEQDKRQPDAAYLAAISTAGADVLYILTGARVGEIKFSPEIPLTISREEAAFLDNYRHSPKDAQESMKTMCAALAQSGVKKNNAA